MTARSGPSAADILLELLDKVPDASTLEILLEPQHLLRLLRAQGWTDEDIRRDLTAGGRAPGELLLAVLAKEPDHAVLLGLLGNPAPPVARPAAPAGAGPRGVATTGPASPRPGPRPVPAIIAGVLLAAPSGWYLFVRLDVLNVPGLIVHFPGAYVLLFSALVGGLLLIGTGIRGLRRGAR
jgi:hypothetical protein